MKNKIRFAFFLCAISASWYYIGKSAQKCSTIDKTPEVHNDDLRHLYVITATYPRPTQVGELTRMAQTLMHVRALTWIVVEDSKTLTPGVEKLLARSGLSYVHLTALMPEKYRKNKKNLPRGVANRMRAVEWLRANATSGVFYFADDDNSYDIRIFEEMRDTKLVSMWPVDCLDQGMGTPVVKEGKVVGFFGWESWRKYAVDMAAFAVSVELLLQRPDAKMPYHAGIEEVDFLKSLEPFDFADIQPKASNCTEVLVWHTQTKESPSQKKVNFSEYENTNMMKLFNVI